MSDHLTPEQLLKNLVYDSTGRLPTTKHEMIAEALKAIDQYCQARERAAKRARIEQNKSFCGCPMCLHHSGAYELEGTQ